MQEDRRYRIWICSLRDVYEPQITALLRYFGSAKAAFTAPESEFGAWKRSGLKWIDSVKDSRTEEYIDQVLKEMKHKGVRCILRGDEDYPQRLRPLPDRPYALFVRGRIPDAQTPCVAVVGARACSAYGSQMASQIAAALTAAGVSVISGMAYGIDSIAQETAVEQGGTSLAILGCGADICYPQGHIGLYNKLLRHGGILSEFACGTPALPRHFPMRNRLISALSDAVVVVEAAKRSGSLITADMALEQGKDVYAVPGRIGDRLSYGCNHLIRQGAGMVVAAEELIEELGLAGTCSGSGADEGTTAGGGALPPMSEEARRIFGCLGTDPVSLEQICAACGLKIGEALDALLDLQLSGCVQESAKNQYMRTG